MLEIDKGLGIGQPNHLDEVSMERVAVIEYDGQADLGQGLPDIQVRYYTI